MSDVRYELRAILAAALIQSKVVDLSGANLMDPAAAEGSQSVQKLKMTVDMLLNAVVYK